MALDWLPDYPDNPNRRPRQSLVGWLVLGRAAPFLETIRPDKWLPRYPTDPNRRPKQSPPGLVVLGRAAPFPERVSADKWLGDLQDNPARRTRQTLEGGFSEPFPESVTIDKWLGEGADNPARRARQTLDGLLTEPATFNEPARLDWLADYPDRINRTPYRPPGGVFQVLAETYTETVSVDRWVGSIPAAVVRRRTAPEGVAVAPVLVPTPTDWRGIEGQTSRTPRAQGETFSAPVYVPAVSVALDWVGEGPDQQFRPRFRPYGAALVAPPVVTTAAPTGWGGSAPEVLGRRLRVIAEALAEPVLVPTPSDWRGQGAERLEARAFSEGSIVAPLFVAPATPFDWLSVPSPSVPLRRWLCRGELVEPVSVTALDWLAPPCHVPAPRRGVTRGDLVEPILAPELLAAQLDWAADYPTAITRRVQGVPGPSATGSSVWLRPPSFLILTDRRASTDAASRAGARDGVGRASSGDAATRSGAVDGAERAGGGDDTSSGGGIA